jgi:alcohol dehydrogenase YqhD (iron-dependent ADH family)
MNIWPAKVIDNNDPDKKGKVQIYIEYLMSDVKPSLYPWAFQDREFTSFIPENNEMVWVWFEDEINYRNPFYKTKLSYKDYQEHNESIGSLTGVYPNIKYIKLKNGVAIALNSDATELSIVAGNGEIFIDSTGIITLKNGSFPEVEKSILGETLKDKLEELIDTIKAITTTGGPTTQSVSTASQTALDVFKTQLTSILSSNVKNN